jgi:hypothetical protein
MSTKQFENTLQALEKRHSTLAGELAKARGLAESAMAKRRSWLLSGNISDQKERKQIDDAVINAQGHETALSDALDETAEKIAEVRQQLDQERDRSARAKAVAELNAKIDALQSAISKYEAVGLELASAVQPLATLPIIDQGFFAKISGVIPEIAAAAAQVGADAHAYSAQIEHGALPLPGKPAPQKVEPPAPHIERKEVFMLEHGSWREGAEVRTARQYSIALLPLKIAKRALEKHLAVDPASESCAKLKALHGVMHGFTALDLCTDLEQGERPTAGPKYFDEQSGEVIGKAVAGTASISR